MPNVAVCDFYLYSVIDSEWLTVKTNLFLNCYREKSLSSSIIKSGAL